MAHNAYDYTVHSDLAAKMLASLALLSPHFLLHACIIALHQLLPVSFYTAAALVVLLAIAGTAALLFKTMKTASGTIRIAGILAICLLMTAPIPLLAPLDGKLYFGYIAANVYHNPTILLLKPFALLVFGLILPPAGQDGATSRKTLVVWVLATVACALAKPSYIIVIVPALIIAGTIPGLRKALTGKVWLISFGFLLPALGILAAQYWITYSTEQIPGVYQGKSGIIFAPLAVMSSGSSWLMVKFFLSIAFPLAVFLAYFREALSHSRLQFAWIGFTIGAAYTYLLAESGPRMLHANFTWSGQITIFILLAVSAEFFCEQIRLKGLRDRSRMIAFIVCTVFFILHVLSGINLYLAQYRAGDYCI